jgi:4-carboxymuconolactone decarboxylase
MDVIHTREGAPERNTADIFLGAVHTKPVVGEQQGGEQFRLLSVTFSPGARTKMHYHTHEQVLIITEGRGIVATEAHEHHVQPGDVVYVPRDEHHWHGAEPEFSMTHIAVNGTGETHIVE